MCGRPRATSTRDGAAALVERWQAAGGDPAASPFESTTESGGSIASSPRITRGSTRRPMPCAAPARPRSGCPGVMSRPARVVAIRLTPAAAHDELDSIFGLAAKVRPGRVRRTERRPPPAPPGAGRVHQRQVLARGRDPGGGRRRDGAVIAVVAWILGIPLLSGILMIVGGFLFVMAVYTFVHEGRKTMRARRSDGESPHATADARLGRARAAGPVRTRASALFRGHRRIGVPRVAADPRAGRGR